MHDYTEGQAWAWKSNKFLIPSSRMQSCGLVPRFVYNYTVYYITCLRPHASIRTGNGNSNRAYADAFSNTQLGTSGKNVIDKCLRFQCLMGRWRGRD